MSRAYDNAADARFQQGGRRNLIINGAMQVSQRGTSFTGNSGFTLDRYYYSTSGGTLNAITQETLSLGQTDLPSQFRKYFKMDMTAGNNNAGVFHRIEDVDVIEGVVTCSFYAKGTNPGGGKFVLEAQQNFGSGGSTANDLGELADIVVTSSWQRFEVTFTIPSLSGKTIGTGSYLYIYIVQPSGDTSTDAWELNLTGLQLEAGNVATPFEHRSYGEELALCQRYFFTSYNRGVAPGTASQQSGAYYRTVDAVTSYASPGPIRYPVTMRATPTVTFYAPNTGTSGKLGLAGEKDPVLTRNGENGCGVYVDNDSTSVGVGSSCQVHITAEAEL